MNKKLSKIPLEVGPIHFVGIGGIGMSGIAEILSSLGYKVRGSDVAESYNTERLRGNNIEVMIGHNADNVAGAGVVVTSTAVKADNPEVVEARKRHIPIVKRSEMLAELMKLKQTIAVGGTHGKTTTTSMVGCVIEKAGLQPTIINGGIINSYGTNVLIGDGDWMVVEADESDGTFIRIPSTVAIITNIDPEHLDYWGDFDKLKAAFRSFVENIPFYGFAVMCVDHPVVQELAATIAERRVITYGFSPQADVRAVNISTNHLGSKFDVVINKAAFGYVITTDAISGVRLSVLGAHNVANSLAAITTALRLGIDPEQIKSALAGFEGVKRRFTITGITNGVTIVDDYAHHPAEITTTLKAARDFATGSNGRVIAVVQPHRYSRLSSLFGDFCAAFNDADTVMVLDVYAAGEKPIDGFNGETLAAGITNYHHKDSRYIGDANNLPAALAGVVRAGDVVLCMGAGSITYTAAALPKLLSEMNSEGAVVLSREGVVRC